MNKTVVVLLFVISFIFIVLQINASYKESLTWDEIQHFKVGYSALVYNEFTVDPLSGTLISQLAVLPALLTSPNIYNSRLVISFLSIITSFTIFSFTKKWFGDKSALLASSLFLFEPHIFAHSHYLTLDIGFTLMFFITFWLLIIFYQQKNLKNLIILGISTGLLLATKVTGFSFFGITLIIFYLFFRKKTPSLKYMLIFLITVFFAIWFIYRFQFANLGGYTEGDSRKSNEIAGRLENINPEYSRIFKKFMTTPFPLGGYLRTVKNAFIYNIDSKSSFFMGEMRENPGRFYPILLLFKTPVSLLIFFVLGIVSLKGTKKFRILLIPVFSILIYMFFSNVNLRLRYILPIYPFFAIISAAGFTGFINKYSVFKIPLLLLLLLFFLVFAKSLPFTISYANEISYYFGKPYTVFSDSNIDWGQGLIALKNYSDDNNIGIINLSYYGTSNPGDYGFSGYSYENICKQPCMIERTANISRGNSNAITAISITSWQECGFYKIDKYKEQNIKNLIGGSILIF